MFEDERGGVRYMDGALVGGGVGDLGDRGTGRGVVVVEAVFPSGELVMTGDRPLDPDPNLAYHKSLTCSTIFRKTSLSTHLHTGPAVGLGGVLSAAYGIC